MYILDAINICGHSMVLCVRMRYFASYAYGSVLPIFHVLYQSLIVWTTVKVTSGFSSCMNSANIWKATLLLLIQYVDSWWWDTKNSTQHRGQWHLWACSIKTLDVYMWNSSFSHLAPWVTSQWYKPEVFVFFEVMLLVCKLYHGCILR